MTRAQREHHRALHVDLAQTRAGLEQLTEKAYELLGVKAPACRRCMNWKRKDSEHGVCWLNADNPQWVEQGDSCQSFRQKVTRVR